MVRCEPPPLYYSAKRVRRISARVSRTDKRTGRTVNRADDLARRWVANTVVRYGTGRRLFRTLFLVARCRWVFSADRHEPVVICRRIRRPYARRRFQKYSLLPRLSSEFARCDGCSRAPLRTVRPFTRLTVFYGHDGDTVQGSGQIGNGGRKRWRRNIEIRKKIADDDGSYAPFNRPNEHAALGRFRKQRRRRPVTRFRVISVFRHRNHRFRP